MQDIFGQVHWRTLTIFDDKKAPEFCNAGAFLRLFILQQFDLLRLAVELEVVALPVI